MTDETKPSDDATDSAKPSDDATDSAKPSDDATDPIFDALWARVVEAWDDDKTHAAILEHAIRAQRLPALAGRYRALERDDAKGDLAKKKLGAIVVAATQMLFAMKTPPPRKAPTALTIATAILCVATLAYLAFVIFRHR